MEALNIYPCAFQKALLNNPENVFVREAEYRKIEEYQAFQNTPDTYVKLKG